MWRMFNQYQRLRPPRCVQNMTKRRPVSCFCLCFILLILFCLVMLIGRLVLPIEIDIKHRDMLEQHKCPACYGENLCADIYHGNIKLTSWTRYTVAKIINARNIYYGILHGKQKIVGKKLGHDMESELLDGAICRMADKAPSYCNPSHYVKFLTTLYAIERKALDNGQSKRKNIARYCNEKPCKCKFG